MKRIPKLALTGLAAAMLLSLSACNLFYRIEPTENAPAQTEPAPAPEETPAQVEIDSPIVGTWHNTYTSDGTTSTLTFYPDGTGKETEQSDAEPGSMVIFTYTVREDYVEITVDTTTLQFTYEIEGDEIRMTYRGHSVAD